MTTLPNGVVVVENGTGSLWGAGGGWQLREELRIGSLDAPGPELFGDIPALEVDEEGRIYVLERGAREIRVFGTAGEHLYTFGREGSGPGELRDPIGFGWGPDGHLWVVDPGNGRFAVFDRRGDFVTAHRRPIAGYMLPWPGLFAPDGHIFDLAFVPGQAPNSMIVRFTPDLARADTFALPSHQGARFELRDAARRITVPVPFAPSQAWVLASPGHVWEGVNDRYRLAKTALQGDTLLLVERSVAAEPVTPAERAEALESLSWFVEQGGQVRPSEVPSIKPFFGAMLVAGDGHLWVTRDPRIGWTRSDVFDPEGLYLGEVTSPTELLISPVPIIRGDHLYALTRNELEVPMVVRLRIVR